MGYIVESDFIHKGYRCVVIMITDMGHRCGYVGIDKNHPLYGVEYSDNADCLKTKEMPDIPVEKAGLGQMLCALTGKYENEVISPEMYFSVHGGITYSGGGEGSKYPVESDLWWYGFDCAHAGDAKDLSAIENPELRKSYAMFNFGTVREKEYCEQECKSLAEQLSKLASQ